MLRRRRFIVQLALGACVQAGARNLLMALWKVDDQATRESMGGFYRRQLTGQPVWRAIQEAQREYLTGQRKAGDEPNPFLWAAFVATGVGVDQ